MNFNDRAELAKKLKEIAIVVGRTIDNEDTKAYFNQLEDCPIELVIKAMDQALRDRDPEDMYIQNTLVTVPEIRAAIERMTPPQEEDEESIAGCAICGGQAWIITIKADGRAVAHPCQCLYKKAKATLDKKQKTSTKGAESRRNAEKIVAAYEYYQKKEEKK